MQGQIFRQITLHAASIMQAFKLCQRIHNKYWQFRPVAIKCEYARLYA